MQKSSSWAVLKGGMRFANITQRGWHTERGKAYLEKDGWVFAGVLDEDLLEVGAACWQDELVRLERAALGGQGHVHEKLLLHMKLVVKGRKGRQRLYSPCRAPWRRCWAAHCSRSSWGSTPHSPPLVLPLPLLLLNFLLQPSLEPSWSEVALQTTWQTEKSCLRSKAKAGINCFRVNGMSVSDSPINGFLSSRNFTLGW